MTAVRYARPSPATVGRTRETKAPLKTAAEQLLVVDVVWAHGIAVVQTVWLRGGDRLGGRRETRNETLTTEAALTLRLAELSGAMFGLDALAAAA
jgi:hypothetical protein